MQKKFLSGYCILGLLLYQFTAFAQKISSEKGLTTALFNTPHGNIKIYLPEDIRPGEMITGRIMAEPFGKNERLLSKSLAELKKYSISFNNEKYLVGNSNNALKCLVPADRTMTGVIELLNESGVKAGECLIPLTPKNDQKQVPSQCNIPTHALCGSPLRITGPFDGDMSTTQCSLDNKPLEILAESPRQCIVSFPVEGTGMHTLNTQETGMPICSKKVSGVEMNLSAGKLNLLKGEHTYIEVKISGLQHLPAPAKLTLNNITHEVVVMQPSNNIIIPLAPDSVKDGMFNRRFDIQSIRAGGFTVNVNLDLPDVMMDVVPGNNNNNNNNNKCNCSVTAILAERITINPWKTFGATIQKGCSGQNCSEKNLTINWEIISGKKNGDIIKVSDDKLIVNVQPKESGSFILKFSGTLTCSDGTTCNSVEYIDGNGEKVPASVAEEKSDDPKNITDPEDPKNPITWDSLPPPGKACLPSLKHVNTPAMVGGLSNSFIGSENKVSMRRDDFIVLEADGADFDMAVIACKEKLKCPESGCLKEIPIAGRVRFEWKTVDDPAGKPDTKGSFVQIGCIPDNNLAQGEHVIFKPPYVPLPVKNDDTTVLSTVILSIIDAGSPAFDPTLEKTITIEINRSKKSPDTYSVKISGGEYKPEKSGAIPETSFPPGCSCKPNGPIWTPGDNLIIPDIILPAASLDNNKLVQGQWVVISTRDQTDMDIATYGCVTTCPTSTIKKSYNDVVRWKWKVEGGGRILLSDSSQFIVYEAPTKFPAHTDFLDIKIMAEVHNPPGLRADPAKIFKSEKILRIYKPGIRLNYPELDWLPEENNKADLKSELVVMSGKSWMPAFDHMCRIQFFELLNVSNEKGKCLNDEDPDKADDCLDLQLKKEPNLEVFAAAKPNKNKCSLIDQFMMGRTEKPVREYIIKVSSLDYGAYGFLRSYVNSNTGEPVEYVTVPWTKEEAKHPLWKRIEPPPPKKDKKGRDIKVNGPPQLVRIEREKANVYTDNRVTIPRDVDENHIADNGWKTAGGKKINDPEFVLNTLPDQKKIKDAKSMDLDLPPDNDIDSIPVGDGFYGDGLSSFEEYRGFKVIVNHQVTQVRTDPGVKSIFVCNEDGFVLNTFKKVSSLEVLEISKAQFIPATRWVNFNFSANTHVVDQAGLYLVNGGFNKNLLGIAESDNGSPTIPNFEARIVIYKEKVIAFCGQHNLKNEEEKIEQVTAHELLHGCNVCHHGEGDESVERSHDIINGLRSGDIFCVMHYDNSGKKSDINYIPEPVGSRLCTSIDGTEYNAPANNTGNNEDGHMYFGDALEGRGNCAAQIRVSGRGERPSMCGNRYDKQKELKIKFRNKKK